MSAVPAEIEVAKVDVDEEVLAIAEKIPQRKVLEEKRAILQADLADMDFRLAEIAVLIDAKLADIVKKFGK